MKFALPVAAIGLSLAALPVLAQEPDYVCYMQTTSGQVMNLTSLCNGRPSAVTVAAPRAASSSGRMSKIGTSRDGTEMYLDRDSITQGGFEVLMRNKNGSVDTLEISMACAERRYNIDKYTTASGRELQPDAEWGTYQSNSPIAKAMNTACQAIGSPGY
jgi:hypothetical protein